MRKGYGEPVKFRSGMKVAWYSYATRAEAEAAAETAEVDAVERARLGYDFGYCVPGEIRETADGLFTVTVP